MFKKLKYFIITIIFANLFIAKNLFAQISIIRDAETEQMLRNICYPIFKIAGQDINNLKIYIVNDESINAFVAGGQNIFINIGLIKKFDNPNVIAGVIAHEIGHIASGHLAKSSEMLNNNLSATLVGYLLGAGAIVAGKTELGASIMLGSSHIGNRLALKYNRSQEEAADILAIEYLKKLKLPTIGFVKIMEYFNQQNIGNKDIVDSYELTHPISSSRIKLVENQTKNYPYKNAKFNKKITHQFLKSQAKLNGFLGDVENIATSTIDNNDDYSQLTKSVIYYRQNNIQKSFEILNDLIQKFPQDGFLYELKAEFLFNQNNIFEAILNYKKAFKYLDDNSKSLAQINIANAIIELKNNDEFLLNFAINNLIKAQKFESDNSLIYKSFANLYQLQNKNDKALLSLAEYNFILNDCDKAQKYAKESIEIFVNCDEADCNKSNFLRANDIIEICKNSKERKSDN